MGQNHAVPEVSATVISAIRFLVNQVENAALQSYWENRDNADAIYKYLDSARKSLDALTRGDEQTLSSCPWGCAGRRCAPNC